MSESIWNRRTNEKSTFLASTGGRVGAGGSEPSGEQEQQHPLEASWTVWFLHRGPGMKISNYLLATKQVRTFSTVEEFWDTYSHLRRVDKLPFTSEFQIFRKGVKPLWEDPINEKGGKWVVRFKRPMKERKKEDGTPMLDHQQNTHRHIQCRQQAALHWENLLLAVLGGSLADGEIPFDEILGLVISVRRDEDILSVWTRSSDNEDAKEKIRSGIKRVLNLPDSFALDYKVHVQSIKEGAQKQALYEQKKAEAAFNPAPAAV
jgi:translation initiation factor 4E